MIIVSISCLTQQTHWHWGALMSTLWDLNNERSKWSDDGLPTLALVMSHKPASESFNDIIWFSWCLKLPAILLFDHANIKENAKAPHYCSFVGKIHRKLVNFLPEAVIQKAFPWSLYHHVNIQDQWHTVTSPRWLIKMRFSLYDNHG